MEPLTKIIRITKIGLLTLHKLINRNHQFMFVQYRMLFSVYTQFVCVMVPIFNGNLGAHIRSIICFLIRSRAAIYRIFFLHARASCSELPSNVSTKVCVGKV